jgi:UDP-galactopyranose mutase
MKFDWLIVGAGFTGAVLAERIATQLDQTSLVVDRRAHVGGNAFDYHDDHGVLVHKYGPHAFHTNSTAVWSYLSQFTSWRPYCHRVRAAVDGHLVPMPFNLTSLERLFPQPMAQRLEQKLVDQYGFGSKVPVLSMLKAADADLKELANYIYRNILEGYTVKQWNLTPAQLDPSVTGRVPVFISRDDRCFQDRYQAVPAQGYAEMFRRILAHPNITVSLRTSYRDAIGPVRFKRMVYTGQVDDYFQGMHGELPYRSLRFELHHDGGGPVQEVGQVNYPNEHLFTRTTEFKHLTGQTFPGTTIAHEYPEAYRQEMNDPYYPIPTEANRERHLLYKREALQLNGSVVFAGRLADYKYYDMDQAVSRSLTLFEQRVAGNSHITAERCPQ